MPQRTEPGPFQGLVREVVTSSKFTNVSLRDATNYFSSVTRRDYAVALRRCFDGQELRSLVSELGRFLPGLNQQVFRETDLGRLSKIAANFGVALQTRYIAGPKGRTLRGFYVNDRTILKAPLIWLNAANHPVGVAAAFWHEMGHHLTHEVFDGRQSKVGLSFTTNYLEHLERPEEIAADLVMVLGCYPRRAAETVFDRTARKQPDSDFDRLASKARTYVRSATGFDFSAGASARANLYTLAGMIHVAKLRLALLREYGI